MAHALELNIYLVGAVEVVEAGEEATETAEKTVETYVYVWKIMWKNEEEENTMREGKAFILGSKRSTATLPQYSKNIPSAEVS